MPAHRFLAGSCLLLLSALQAAAAADILKVALKERSNVVVTDIQASMTVSLRKCDAFGNIYVRVVGSGSPLKSPITKIGADGKVKATYSYVDYGHAIDFTISKTGVDVIASQGPVDSLLHFADDGKLDNVTKLPFGNELRATGLIQAGEILLFHGEKGSPDENPQRVMFTISPAGEIVYIDAHGSLGKDDKSALAGLIQMTSDESGNVFVMRSSDPVVVLELSGTELVKTYSISSPEPGYFPSMIYANHGRIAIQFQELHEGRAGSKMVGPNGVIRVTDEVSGEPLVDYVTPTHTRLDCQVGLTEFVALCPSNDDRRFHLVTFSE